MVELSKTYDSQIVESKWYSFWTEKGYFSPQIKAGKKPYVIVIPPPNVTGVLHMGHGLNNTIQDILIRWQRMKGVPALWVPGTDHAGIATQNVVEKKLAKEKKTRHDLGREAFIEEVWQWKEQHGSTIINQLKRLGCSCDWSRERFTMDAGLSKAVREVFVRLYEKGLVYRGYYIVNWCVRCHTALSDEEAAHKEVQGKLYYLKYPIKKGTAIPERLDDSAVHGIDYVVVATTRPETMLGDTGIAVNPEDERYLDLDTKEIYLPLINRPLRVIRDAFVDPAFGTGVVKVTPAHDPNDFEMGKRHDLPEINILNPDGVINEQGGAYEGLDRFAARKKIIKDLKARGFFIEEKEHMHAVGHCYRCDTVVEPYLSKQWFVKMKPLAEKAIEVAQNGSVTFLPERWYKVYINWMENIRDWCISRQIWWGHSIPVWYCNDCEEIIVAKEDPVECTKCSSKNIEQDPDVLDTWFSSWLWPFSTLGWPDKTKDLSYFYPTSVLSTAPEILFFWVARMIMAGLEFMGEIPFHTVYLHGTVRDETGRKMSKSLGNSIDPVEIIDEIGADALRFIVISLTAAGQDVYLSKQRFEMGRNFTNKIWNAARFSFMNMDGFNEGSCELDVAAEKLSIINKWILSGVTNLVADIEQALSKYRFNDACHCLYSFIWNNFCDWYLELAKPAFYGKRGEEEKLISQKVLFYLWVRMLKLLHPFMPHITEELWQLLSQCAPTGTLDESIMISAWPVADEGLIFKDEEAMVILLQDIVVGVRDKRAQHTIPPAKPLKLVLISDDADIIAQLGVMEEYILTLARIETVAINNEFKKAGGWAPLKLTYALKHLKAFVFIGDVVDLDKERARIDKERLRLSNLLQAADKKLANDRFVQQAPPEVVEKERQKRKDLESALEKLTSDIGEL